MQWPIAKNSFIFLSVLLIASCGGGSGDGLDDNGKPVISSSPKVPLTATLSSIQENIFSVNCALPGCHIPGTAPFGLSLDTRDTSAALTISIVSVEDTTLNRIEPFDPDNSYIVKKIEGQAGARMPLGRPALSDEEITIIRQWITDGAVIN